MADGTHLPVGALVGADTNHNVFKHSTLENPDVFDGFRFERLRDQENSDSKYQVSSSYHVDLFFPYMPLADENTSFLEQAVSTGNDHLVFGLGTQACPGRFFAIHEAKVVMARFLKYYDFKLSDNPPGHPMRQAAGVLTVIDPTAKFWFKRRSG